MKCRLVPIASSCTSTLVGTKLAPGTARASAIRAPDGAVCGGTWVGAALSAGPLLEWAPSQPTAPNAHAKSAAVRQKVASFRLFRTPSAMPKYAYHPCVREGRRRHD